MLPSTDRCEVAADICVCVCVCACVCARGHVGECEKRKRERVCICAGVCMTEKDYLSFYVQCLY